MPEEAVKEAPCDEKQQAQVRCFAFKSGSVQRTLVNSAHSLGHQPAFLATRERRSLLTASELSYQETTENRLKAVRGEAWTVVKHWLQLVQVSLVGSIW